MATYQDIKGLKVKYLSADPGTLRAGEVWYNSTTGTLKGVVNIESFSSGAPVSTARGWCAFAGDKSTALLVGGSINSYPSVNTGAEEYNGTGWTSATSAPFAGIGTVGCGTQTSALVFGGGHTYTNVSAEYDGSSWTVTGSMNLTCRSRSSAGTQTAGLGADAYQPGTQAVKTTEEYNGTGWTTVTASGTARYDGAGLGIQTAAISCGGRNPPTTSLSAAEDYDGSAWTAAASMPEGKENQGGSGSQTAATVFGGTNNPPTYPALNTKIDYDGSTWSTSPATLATARRFFGGQGGTSADVLCASGAGDGPGQTYITNTEEFNSSLNVVTAGAWASGNNMNTAQQNPGGFGTQTAGVSVGGEEPPNSNKTENYDGSSWSVSGVYPASLTGIGTAGTQTAGLGFGGRDPAGVTTAAEYDGSSWTAATAYPTAIALACGVGPQTAALAATGDVYPTSPRYSDLCNDYNGTSWTAATSNTGTARYDAMAAGIATAAAICGGNGSGETEEYDGTNWTAGGTNLLNISAGGSSKNGTSDDWMVFSLNSVTTTGYDGTAWSTRPSLVTSRYGAGGCGTGPAGLCFGGRDPGFSTATEEFNGATSVATASTLTTS